MGDAALQGRKRARESGGVSTVTGGVAQAAAAAAQAAAVTKSKQAGNFYRFQQRDKRRSGEPTVQRLQQERLVALLLTTAWAHLAAILPNASVLIAPLYSVQAAL